MGTRPQSLGILQYTNKFHKQVIFATFFLQQSNYKSIWSEVFTHRYMRVDIFSHKYEDWSSQQKAQMHIQKTKAAVHSDHWYLFTKLLNIISQKTITFIYTLNFHLKKTSFFKNNSFANYFPRLTIIFVTLPAGLQWAILLIMTVHKTQPQVCPYGIFKDVCMCVLTQQGNYKFSSI